MPLTSKDRQKFNADLFPVPDNYLDEVVVWVGNNLIPEDVFEPRELAAWAWNNGYRKFD